MTEFFGRRSELEAFLLSVSGRYYVYELCRPNGEVFYVGKGLNRRAVEHEMEAVRNHPIGESNPFKCNVIRQVMREGDQINYRIVKVFEATEEFDCLKLEADLIQKHGRRHEGGTLTNLAGGIGSTSGSSPYSVEKHAKTLSGSPENNPDRATLNQFLQGIGAVGSVPIKPIRQMSRILPTTPHPNARRPTARCAYALVASAAAHGLPFSTKMLIPRSFVYEGVHAIIENGVARDLLKAKMATLVSASDPADEAFELSEQQVNMLINLVGRSRLNSIGLT
ncbi:GIY-YIG nuclease family protein [Roseovarius sp. PS-C2]|uniref:GIY-YIG nuclease family protein n=1 Tax=Roseovarius sp. PS-C2 TaxID=2820814 RepID=UPI001C0D5959|nr:GIY-YIG nuclease family protein [Roseovarius sp. PS-C2]MBU3260994.1 GIY-YIG nuclease family protein [Roseovarius sp. PS-C2]